MQCHFGRASAGVPTLAACGLDAPPLPADALARAETAPVVFFWWATSPRGRKSVHLRLDRFDRLAASELVTPEGVPVLVPTRCYDHTTGEIYARLRAAARATLPHVPHGYTWQGPFLVWDAPRPTEDGPFLGAFHFTRYPLQSRTTPPARQGDMALARALAHSILGRIAPA